MAFLDRVASAYADPVRRAKLIYWLWMASTAFMVLGFVVILVKVLLE